MTATFHDPKQDAVDNLLHHDQIGVRVYFNSCIILEGHLAGYMNKQ